MAALVSSVVTIHVPHHGPANGECLDELITLFCHVFKLLKLTLGVFAYILKGS